LYLSRLLAAALYWLLLWVFPERLFFLCSNKGSHLIFLKDGLFSYLFSLVCFSLVLATVLIWIFTKKCSKFEIRYLYTMCLNNPKFMRNGSLFVRYF